MKKRFLLLLSVLSLPLLCTLLLRCTPDKEFLYVRPNVLVFDTLGPRILGNGDSTGFQSHYLTVLMPVETYNVSVPLPGISSAYASYKEPYPRAIEQIKQIEIVNLFPYGSLPAGSDISDSCLYFDDHSDNDSALFSGPLSASTKQDIISDMNKPDDRYLFTAGDARKRFSFRLPKAPAGIVPQRLAVVFITKEMSRYTDTTDLFYLKP